MFTTMVLKDEVYVFHNGVLLYKRWFRGSVVDKERSIILNKYGSPTELPPKGKM